MNLGRTFFQPLNEAIDCETRFGYLEYQTQIQCDLAYGFLLSYCLWGDI